MSENITPKQYTRQEETQQVRVNHKPTMKKESIHRLSSDKSTNIRTNPPINMTLKEAAAYLTCSPRWIRDQIKDGTIKFHKVGSKYVFTRTELDAFLNK